MVKKMVNKVLKKENRIRGQPELGDKPTQLEGGPSRFKCPNCGSIYSIEVPGEHKYSSPKDKCLRCGAISQGGENMNYITLTKQNKQFTDTMNLIEERITDTKCTASPNINCFYIRHTKSFSHNVSVTVHESNGKLLFLIKHNSDVLIPLLTKVQQTLNGRHHDAEVKIIRE